MKGAAEGFASKDWAATKLGLKGYLAWSTGDFRLKKGEEVWLNIELRFFVGLLFCARAIFRNVALLVELIPALLSLTFSRLSFGYMTPS